MSDVVYPFPFEKFSFDFVQNLTHALRPYLVYQPKIVFVVHHIDQFTYVFNSWKFNRIQTKISFKLVVIITFKTIFDFERKQNISSFYFCDGSGIDRLRLLFWELFKSYILIEQLISKFVIGYLH